MSEKTIKTFGINEAKAILPEIRASDNKTTRGRSLILAGSLQYPGAGVLAARGALRAGSGYVTLAQAGGVLSSLDNPDFLTLDLQNNLLDLQKFNAVAIGPGFGVNANTEKYLTEFSVAELKNVVVDADGISTLAMNTALKVLPTWILTPHEGELARVMNVSSQIIHENRHEWAQKAQERFDCVIVLKGHRTLVASSDEIFEINAGNPALAKSGTGDVLTGLITGFLAQGLEPLQAACLGVFIHGRAADLWVSEGRDALSLMASDLLELIPRAIHQIRSV